MGLITMILSFKSHTELEITSTKKWEKLWETEASYLGTGKGVASLKLGQLTPLHLVHLVTVLLLPEQARQSIHMFW
jgi:hypothetical protein